MSSRERITAVRKERITINFKRPSSNPPSHPIDLIAENSTDDENLGVVSAFVILEDGSRNSLGMFTPDTTIAELLRRAKRAEP